MFGNSVEAAPLAFLPGICGIGSEPVKAALADALVPPGCGPMQYGKSMSLHTGNEHENGRRRQLLGVGPIETSFRVRKVKSRVLHLRRVRTCGAATIGRPAPVPVCWKAVNPGVAGAKAPISAATPGNAQLETMSIDHRGDRSPVASSLYARQLASPV
jgi:hypothetical protein